MEIFLYYIVIIYGLLIGSFLNVLILRIPEGENFVVTRSHCVKCGYQLAWYDMIPVFSYLFLGGKCRKCGEKISVQYPVIEALNAILYFVVFYVNGFQVLSVLYCLVASVLLVIAVIDFRTYEIPLGLTIFIGIMGIIRAGMDFEHISWRCYTYDGGRISIRLEECDCGIFLGMYDWFCMSFDSYESIRSRQGACTWTISIHRCISYDVMGR